MPSDLLRPDRLRCSFAGLRVLPPGEGRLYEAPREHIVRVDPAGMISVGGGKLTTHRFVALDALRALPGDLRPRKLLPNAVPLSGSPPPDARALRTLLGGTTAGHLMALYGGEADKLLEYATRFPDALAKVHPGGPDIWAQVYHTAAEGWALTVDDVARRRTALGIRGPDTEEVRARISSSRPPRPIRMPGAANRPPLR